ncbi:protein kinase [Streptomyces sp. NPDC051636]|uniref:serine/threonine-protein kinase n=1 Tax=Streptomyces sp. NPDC051636 TaxID=3365663 RepID=UPI0037A152BA
MGRVWRAADEILDRQVAVKEMRIDGLDAEDTGTRRERTLREARATARIDHPNVVRVYDVVDEGERLWIVMELVAGRSLEQITGAEGPLGPRETARIGLGLVAALRQVHAGGVLHRDIKPGNVLVENGGSRVVLTDFGIAAIQDAKALTMVGMLVGSPDYMAPERISGRHQGPPSDVWSLGATLCAALAGRSPFHRDTTLATLHAVLYEEPGLPPAAGPLRDLLAALLEKEPSTRPDLTEVETALRPVAYPAPTPALRVPEGVPESGETGDGGAGPAADGGGGAVGDGAGDSSAAGAEAESGARRLEPEPGAEAPGGELAGGSEASANPVPGPETPGETPVFARPPRERPTPAFAEAFRVRATRDPRVADPERELASGPETARSDVPSAVTPVGEVDQGRKGAAVELRPAGRGPGAPARPGVSLVRAEAVTRRRPNPGPPDPRRNHPAGPPPGEPSAPAPGHRRTAVLAALGVVAVAAVAAVLLATSVGGPGGGGTQAGSAPAGTSASAPPTPRTSPSPTVEGTARPRSLPPGAHREAGGFAWRTPDGWRRDVKTGAEVHYTSPDGRQELVAKSSLAHGDLMDTWRASERDARRGRDYAEIRLEETAFRGYPAVVWEYTFTLKGVAWHALLLGFDANGKSYQVNTWFQLEIGPQALKTYGKVKDSFTAL